MNVLKEYLVTISWSLAEFMESELISESSSFLASPVLLNFNDFFGGVTRRPQTVCPYTNFLGPLVP